MLLTVIRREILGHLLSLRFGLMAVLVLALMAANGFLFAGERSTLAVTQYNENVRQAREEIESLCEQGLNHLAEKGPGELYRRPGTLVFCVSGGDGAMPSRIDATSHSSYGWRSNEFSYSWKMPWNLQYTVDTPLPTNPALPSFAELDWSFAIGVALSLMALLLTYDAISGERRDGTLRLAMANPVPRDLLLLGKYLAALFTVAGPLLLGVVVSLLILLAGGSVDLAGDDWVRLALAVGLSLVYVSVFAGLGLLVSALVRRPTTGLLGLLLLWVLSVELVPGGLGVLGMHLAEPISSVEGARQGRALVDGFIEHAKQALFTRLSPSQAPDDEQVLRDWADALNEFRDGQMELLDRTADRQLQRVSFARTLTRLSPTAVYRYGLEALAGTGFSHYRSFVSQARRYRDQFHAFLQGQDRADPDSPHHYFVREGVSARPVDPRIVPHFADRFPLAEGLRAAVWDIVVLVVLAVLLFLAAYLSFLRCDLAES